MNDNKYDFIVYIGRFQPLHIAHLDTIKQANELADRVIVLIGSSESPRTIKNPFTYPERVEIIKHAMHPTRVSMDGIPDYDYDDSAWIAHVDNSIKELTKGVMNAKIGFIGYDKDESSFYLNYFPQYDFIQVDKFPKNGATIDATKIRNLWYSGDVGFTEAVLPNSVFNDLEDIYHSTNPRHAWFDELIIEQNFVNDYKKSWAGSPYPPQFVTADAVVVQSGHVLLIQRGDFPCKGQWAMAGGFVNENESMNDAVVRELIEETKIKVPEKILKRLVKTAPREFFDKPSRSSRGRTFTQAYLIQLNDDEKLPRIKGSDDAQKAEWIPISEFKNMQDVMFEDHYAIVNKMLNKLV